jgi:hypothetical protein
MIQIIHEFVNTLYPMMFKLSPMYWGFRVYLYGPLVINLSSTPIVFFSPNVAKAHPPTSEPNTQIPIANGSLVFKGGNTKLSKSTSPRSKKFTITRLATSQEQKNCQDRGVGGGQKRKPGNFIVRTNKVT